MSTAQPAAKEDKGDMVDQAVAFVTKKSGHATDRKTTEKISDFVRTGWKKLTGKNLPIEDKN